MLFFAKRLLDFERSDFTTLLFDLDFDLLFFTTLLLDLDFGLLLFTTILLDLDFDLLLFTTLLVDFAFVLQLFDFVIEPLFLTLAEALSIGTAVVEKERKSIAKKWLIFYG